MARPKRNTRRRRKGGAYLMGAEHVAALIETAEILANPAALTAIADAESNRGRVYTLDEIPD